MLRKLLNHGVLSAVPGFYLTAACLVVSKQFLLIMQNAPTCITVYLLHRTDQ
jgi:hypothetical protein